MSGKVTHLRHLHTWPEQPCLQSGMAHRQAPGGSPHLPSGEPEGWSTPLSRCNWGRLQTTAETAELHTPECCPMPRWSPLASAMGGPACWTEDFVSPAAHLAPEILPCKTLMTPLPPCCLPDLQIETLGLRSFPPLISVCVCYIPLRLLQCE